MRLRDLGKGRSAASGMKGLAALLRCAAMTSGSLVDGKSPNLTRVAVYRRTVRASQARVWENVLDWEHLPWLHRRSFRDLQIEEAGAWGWRAAIVTSQGRELRLELLVERDASRYVSRTVEGDGAGTEIWTRLEGRADHATDIEVEFWLPDIRSDAVDAVGAGYTRLYTELWDEDEEMMREREVRLVSRRAGAGADLAGVELALGDLRSLREKLPLRMEFAGEPIWLVELAGGLLTHTAVCPHMLGPLPRAGCDDDDPAVVECPWHGYRFDVRSGASCDGRDFEMKPGPEVVIENGQVRLVARPS